MKKSTLTASSLHHVNLSMWLSSRWLRAFLSSILKNLAFTLSKPIFITYNTPHYNTTYIKTSIFLPFHLNNVSLLFFNNFLFFLSLLCLSLSHSTAGTNLPTTHPKPTTHTTTTTNKKRKKKIIAERNLHIQPQSPHTPTLTASRCRPPPSKTKK